MCCSLSSKQSDTILRLYYHIGVTAADLAVVQKDSKSTKATIQANILCLAAVLALGDALVGCRIDPLVLRRIEGDKQNALFPFPVPIPQSCEETATSANEGITKTSIVPDQLLGIGIFSILAAARVLAMQIQQEPQEWNNCETSNQFGVVQSICHMGMKEKRYLLQQLGICTARLWIQASVHHDVAVNILSHCKKIQRILWDVANTCNDNPEERLLLQGDAICVSLLHSGDAMDTGDMNSKVQHAFLRNQLESGCSFAWKAAETYHRNNSNVNKAVLLRYYQSVGAALDAFVPSEIPWYYIEYYAYRAMHVGWREIPSQHLSSDKMSSKHGFLNFFLLILNIQEELHAICDKDENNEIPFTTNHAREMLLQVCDKLRCASVSTRHSYYKVLSLLKLHRTVNVVMKHRTILSSRQSELILLVSNILSECIGPLCLGLVIDKALDERQWSVGTEIFKQSIEAFDVIPKSTEKSALNTKVIEELTNILLNSSTKPPQGCVENVGKFLYMIGKKRLEFQESTDALIPMIYSMKLFLSITPYTSPELLKSLNISGRLAFLSTTYASLGFQAESIIATTLALAYDTLESSFNKHDGNSLVQLLDYFISLTRDVVGSAHNHDVFFSGQRTGLVNSLVRLSSQRQRSSILAPSKQVDALASTELIDVLLTVACDPGYTVEQLFEDRFGIVFNLYDVFQVIYMQNVMSIHPCIDLGWYFAEKSCVVAEVLVKLGQVFQRKTHDLVENQAASFIDYHNFCQLAESCLENIGLVDDVQKRLFKTTMLVIASISMISNLTPVKYDSWGIAAMSVEFNETMNRYLSMAEIYADKAFIILGDNSDLATDWDLVDSTTSLALKLYRFQLLCLRGHEETPTIDMEVLNFVVKGVADAILSNSALGKMSLHSLVRSLVRMCGIFSTKGEVLQALKIAEWNTTLTHSDDVNSKHWFEAGFLSLMLNESLTAQNYRENLDANLFRSMAVTQSDTRSIRLCASVLNDKSCDELADVSLIPISFKNRPDSDMTLFESAASRLRFCAKSSNDESCFEMASSGLQEILDKTTRRLQESSRSNSDLILIWSVTTAMFGLSECAEKMGNLDLAIKILRECYNECRNLLSLLTARKKITDIPFWFRAAQASMPIRCVDRQIECLQKSAVLYCRLGDRKKSIEYARWTMRAILHNHLCSFEDPKSTLFELLHCSRSQSTESSQEVRLRRLLLLLKAQMSPYESVVNEFLQGDVAVPYLSLVDRKISQNKRTVNLELELLTDSCGSEFLILCLKYFAMFAYFLNTQLQQFSI